MPNHFLEYLRGLMVDLCSNGQPSPPGAETRERTAPPSAYKVENNASKVAPAKWGMSPEFFQAAEELRKKQEAASRGRG